MIVFRFISSERMDHCVLCGIDLSHDKKRFVGSSEVERFLLHHCQNRHVLFDSVLMRTKAFKRSGLCVPCVNWKRRIENMTRRRRVRPLLQIEQLALHILRPGSISQPDKRCMMRLFKSIRSDSFPYPLPVPVKTIVNNMKEGTHQDALRCWWDYNGRTRFFENSAQARRIRWFIKRQMDSA